MMQAGSAASRAQLEMLKNEMLPKIRVEKNTLALEEAQARLKALKQTYDLKRRAAEADIKVLEIRRDRSANAMRQAATNADRMQIKSPISGIAVIKPPGGSNMAELQEGDEVARVSRRRRRESRDHEGAGEGTRPTSGSRRTVRRCGRPGRYPGCPLVGTVDQISPIGVQSSLSPRSATSSC
jgi:multidrug efflux pump subunit AcrA (membrane-fusion protein)